MIKIANEQLRDDVLAELDCDPVVNARTIGVAVDDGVVTLTGNVANFAQKWAAEEATRRVKGVRAIAEELHVDLPTGDRRSDTDLAHAVALALSWNALLPQSIQSVVRDGYVTLTGEADWHFQRQEAADTIRRIAGVRGVNNTIALSKWAVGNDVSDQIHRIFERDAQIDADRVHIAAHGGTVTLTGNVRSWFERNEANRAAWSIKGIVAGDNQLTVGGRARRLVPGPRLRIEAEAGGPLARRLLPPAFG